MEKMFCLKGTGRRQIIIHPEIISYLRFFPKGKYDVGLFGFKHLMNWRYILRVKIWPLACFTS